MPEFCCISGKVSCHLQLESSQLVLEHPELLPQLHSSLEYYEALMNQWQLYSKQKSTRENFIAIVDLWAKLWHFSS